MVPTYMFYLPQDDQGNVLGEVIVSLPDGRIQTTNYNAHYYDG